MIVRISTVSIILKKRLNELCGQNAKFLNVKPFRTFINHRISDNTGVCCLDVILYFASDARMHADYLAEPTDLTQ